ncbi:hypothetical protein DVH24_010094, partial [Malus domestica]
AYLTELYKGQRRREAGGNRERRERFNYESRSLHTLIFNLVSEQKKKKIRIEVVVTSCSKTSQVHALDPARNLNLNLLLLQILPRHLPVLSPSPHRTRPGSHLLAYRTTINPSDLGPSSSSAACSCLGPPPPPLICIRHHSSLYLPIRTGFDETSCTDAASAPLKLAVATCRSNQQFAIKNQVKSSSPVKSSQVCMPTSLPNEASPHLLVCKPMSYTAMSLTGEFNNISISETYSLDVKRELLMLSLLAILGQAIDPLAQLMETAYIGNLENGYLDGNTNGKPKPFDGIVERKQLSSVSTALLLAVGIGIFEAVALSLGSGLFLNMMGISSVVYHKKLEGNALHDGFN